MGYFLELNMEKRECFDIWNEFQENKCEVVIYNHIWRSMYFTTGHLRAVIAYSEYMELFEYIWKDRAASAGWKISFVYTDESTVLVFNR